MTTRVHYVPAVKLWTPEDLDQPIVVLECDCGTAVDYPGHPDDRTEVECRSCGTRWSVEARPTG